ncbi:unnamed protein product, partial [Mesorhabditis belari]|uniref:Uncharacterized protein n=1 Tax=Mesorhabditis belari TaxID=2138241 RepID=A0AAF3EHP9_9BILA
MKLATRLIILNCYSKFAQHGNVVQIEKKYGKHVTEWMYQNARHLLSSVDDANCQMVVHAAEALLVNATALTDLPTEEPRNGAGSAVTMSMSN